MILSSKLLKNIIQLKNLLQNTNRKQILLKEIQQTLE